MQITALQIGIKDKERVNVYVDDKFRIAIDKNTLTQEHLFVGKEIDNNLIEKLKELDTYNYLYRKIVDWTFVKPRSSKEIHDKLKKIISNRSSSSFNYNIDFNSLNTFIINKLADIGITDTKYALWLIENRLHQGKYGKQRIYSELISKGVSSSLAKELLLKNYTEDENKVSNLLQKKFGVTTVKDIKDTKIKNKAYRFLLQKGFSPR